MNQCNCNAGIENLKASYCPDLTKAPRRLIFVPEFGSDGAKNEFASVSAFTLSAVTAMINEVDKLDRIYPMSNKLEEAEYVANPQEVQTFTSGNMYRAENGLVTFKAFIPLQGGIYQGKLQSIGCQKGGFYIVDKIGNVSYMTDALTKTKMQPILMDENSFRVYPKKGKDKEVVGLFIEFNFRRQNDESLIRTVLVDSLDFNPLNDIDSLIDVTSVNSNVGQTALDVTLTDDYGSPVSDLVAGDFALYNISTSLAITVLTAVETSVGVYHITYASQTVGNIIRITPTLTGADFAKVVSNVATVA